MKRAHKYEACKHNGAPGIKFARGNMVALFEREEHRDAALLFLRKRRDFAKALSWTVLPKGKATR